MSAQRRARFVLLATSIALSVGVVECGYRIFRGQDEGEKPGDREWRERISNLNRTIYRRTEAPGIVYEPKPGASFEMPYGPAAFDEHGARPLEATTASRRIAVLGDSIAWGEEVASRDSIPGQLQRVLAPEAEVLNFGVSGYDTEQELHWYQEAVRPLEPEVVIVLFCLNDAFIMSGAYNAHANEDEEAAKAEQDRFFEATAPVRAETIDWVASQAEDDAWLKSFARLAWLWRMHAYDQSEDYTDEYLIMYAQPERRTRLARAIEALGEAILEDGAAAHFIISPVLRGWDNYHWSDIHEDVAEWAEAAGFTVHDPLAHFRSRYRPEQLGWDSLHYTAEGAGIFAEWLASRLELPP